MNRAIVKLPARVARGTVIDIRTLAQHPMETGYRHDAEGKRIPRHILVGFRCTWNGAEVFSARLNPGITANPYIAFSARAEESGELVFTWTDDRGGVHTETARVEVE